MKLLYFEFAVGQNQTKLIDVDDHSIPWSLITIAIGY